MIFLKMVDFHAHQGNVTKVKPDVVNELSSVDETSAHHETPDGDFDFFVSQVTVMEDVS